MIKHQQRPKNNEEQIKPNKNFINHNKLLYRFKRYTIVY